MTLIDMIGCGRMGQAMLRRWLEVCDSARFRIVKPSPLGFEHARLTYVSDVSLLNADVPDVVLLAVKPQMMLSVLPDIYAYYGNAPIYLTIAAGLDIAAYRKIIGERACIVRAMPNMPVAIGRGVISLVDEGRLDASKRDMMTTFFDALGVTCWLEEEQLDIATALAGSGPAYVYLFLEALCDAATAHGLPVDIARTLATGMMEGAAVTAKQTDETFKQLQNQVASKGGTTEAALEIFADNDALHNLVRCAMDAAIERAERLRKN